MYVSTQAGTVLEIDLEEDNILSKWDSKENRNVLGIKRVDNELYVCTQSKLYRLRLPDYTVLKKKNFGDNSFHHIMIKDDYIFLTSTEKNAVFMLDMKFKKKKTINIAPPIKEKPVEWKTNYNHMNNIVYYKGKYYVELNWLTTTQYSDSGIAVLDEDFNEIERFKYGWESHGFCRINNKMHVLCGTSNPENAKHSRNSKCRGHAL